MFRSFRGLVARGAVLAFVGTSVAGCYSYVPIQGVPDVGADVRANLTTEEAIRMSDRTGQVSRMYDGRLMGLTDDSVSISVITARGSEFTTNQTLRQILTVPRSGVEQLSTRQLSLWRTAVVGALAGVAVAAAVSQVTETGGDDGGGDGGDPTGTLAPIFRFILGR